MTDLIGYRDNNILIVVAIAVITVFVFWHHRENITNLLSGDEPRIGRKNN